MLLTGLGQVVPSLSWQIYVVKTIITGILLFHFRKYYKKDLDGCIDLPKAIEAVCAGLLVLATWIFLEDFLPKAGNPTGFNPAEFSLGPVSEKTVLAIRILGAALVVPFMEELFWRSFLMRYLVNSNFQAVRLGTFTWFSFMAVTLLFGLEHYRIIQGIVAGAVFGLLVIKQKNLGGAIISHAVTNLGLGIYVLTTGSWHLW